MCTKYVFATRMCSFGATPFGMFVSLAINIAAFIVLLTQLVCYFAHDDAIK